MLTLQQLVYIVLTDYKHTGCNMILEYYTHFSCEASQWGHPSMGKDAFIVDLESWVISINWNLEFEVLSGKVVSRELPAHHLKQSHIKQCVSNTYLHVHVSGIGTTCRHVCIGLFCLWHLYGGLKPKVTTSNVWYLATT